MYKLDESTPWVENGNENKAIPVIKVNKLAAIMASLLLFNIINNSILNGEKIFFNLKAVISSEFFKLKYRRTAKRFTSTFKSSNYEYFCRATEK